MPLDSFVIVISSPYWLAVILARNFYAIFTQYSEKHIPGRMNTLITGNSAFILSIFRSKYATNSKVVLWCRLTIISAWKSYKLRCTSISSDFISAVLGDWLAMTQPNQESSLSMAPSAWICRPYLGTLRKRYSSCTHLVPWGNRKLLMQAAEGLNFGNES